MLRGNGFFGGLASAGGALLLSALFVFAAVGPAEIGTGVPADSGIHARLA